MDMSTMDHGAMGGMSMGDGVPGLFYMQQMYWKVIGSVIGFAFAINVFHRLLAIQRIRTGSAKPARPYVVPYATITALLREINYASLPSFSVGKYRYYPSTLGRLIILLSNFAVILILCFYKLDTFDQWSWEKIGYRTGFIGLTQLPLIFLLAGKKNIIGFFTGVSYERLNYFHRWTARTLWITIVIHMSFWFRSWARYDYIVVKLKTDVLTQRGFAAWIILTFIVLSSLAPVRQWSYDLFVIIHLVTYAGFIGAVWIHVPDEVKAWVWTPIAIFFFDRLMRVRRIVWNNISTPLFGRRWRIGNQASFTPLPGNITRITISNPMISWKPGQHVLLSCHSVVPLQSHPFTISTLPSDKKMEFLVKSETGATKRLHSFASKHHDETLPLTAATRPPTRKALIEGPYGKMRTLNQFDTLVFFAGSTGATFTMPLMRDVIENWDRNVAPYMRRFTGNATSVVRSIRFVWAIKGRDRLSWFEDPLDEVVSKVNAIVDNKGGSHLTIEIGVYITCDSAFTDDPRDASTPVIGAALHGPAEDVKLPSSSTSTYENQNETRDAKGAVSVHSIASSATERDDPNQQTHCGSNGTCCCRRSISDDPYLIDTVECTCNSMSSSTPSYLLSTVSRTRNRTTEEHLSEKPQSSLRTPQSSPSRAPAATMTLRSGRPNPESIIRRSLEQALGESAVIVCGPRGLREEVRRSVVRLSDERAVHKGTGAQGIWLHDEGFEY